MATRIQVTQEHIDNGKRRMTTCCPIALACRPKFGMVSVGSGLIGAMVDGEYHTYTMPEDAKLFVFAFDNGETVKPFTMILE